MSMQTHPARADAHGVPALAPSWRQYGHWLWPAGIFLLALAARLAWVLLMDRRALWYDEYEYSEIAWYWVQGHPFKPQSYRANPVLPFYLMTVYSVFGKSVEAARVGQAVFGALSCVLVYAIGRRTLSPLAGVLAGVMLALYPAHIYLSGILYVECLLIFLLTLGAYLAVLPMGPPAWRGRDWVLALAGGAVLGVAGLTRTLYLVAIPAVAVAWLYALPGPVWRRIALAGTLAAAGAAVVLPYMARNQAVYGRFMVTSGFYTKLWQGNNELATGGPMDRELHWDQGYMMGGRDRGGWEARVAALPIDEQLAIRAKYAELDMKINARAKELGDDYFLAADELLKPVILEEMRSNPGRTAGLFFTKLGTLYSAFSEPLTPETYADASRGKRLVAAATFYPLLALAAAGLIVLFPRRGVLSPLVLIIASTSVAYGVLNACTRFRLPIDPFLMVLAGGTLAWCWQRAWEIRRGRQVGRCGAEGA